MTKLKIKTETVIDEIKSDQIEETIETNEFQRTTISKCILVLIHVSKCENDLCDDSCRRLKRLIRHVKKCRKQSNQESKECKLCKQFLALCCYHAKRCEDVECSVPYCASFKKSFKK